MIKIPDDLKYRPKKPQSKNIEEILEVYSSNFNTLIDLDKEAEKRGLYVGRYITHPIADGHAVYQIVSETKKKIKVVVVTDIGDDWVIPAWGSTATIDKKYADLEFSFRKFLREKNNENQTNFYHK